MERGLSQLSGKCAKEVLDAGLPLPNPPTEPERCPNVLARERRIRLGSQLSDRFKMVLSIAGRNWVRDWLAGNIQFAFRALA